MHSQEQHSNLTPDCLRTLGLRKLSETVCGWEREEYGVGMHRQPTHLQAMIQKNQDGMLCIFDKGDLVAYADVWQLQNDFYDQLKQGVISEEEIRAHHVLSPTDAPTRSWYVGSIITSPSLRLASPERAPNTFLRIYSAILKFSATFGQSYRIFGVASSPFGEKLLSKFHFNRVVPTHEAIDTRPRFELVLAGKTNNSAPALH